MIETLCHSVALYHSENHSDWDLNASKKHRPRPQGRRANYRWWWWISMYDFWLHVLYSLQFSISRRVVISIRWWTKSNYWKFDSLTYILSQLKSNSIKSDFDVSFPIHLKIQKRKLLNRLSFLLYKVIFGHLDHMA